MGLIFRKQIKLGKRSRINLSKSGASVSTKMGRVTLNSRGRGSVRIAKGISWRW